MKAYRNICIVLGVALVLEAGYIVSFSYWLPPVPPVPSGVVRTNNYLGIHYRRPLTKAERTRLEGPDCVIIRYKTGGQYDDVTTQCGADKYTPVRPGWICQHTSPEEMVCVPERNNTVGWLAPKGSSPKYAAEGLDQKSVGHWGEYLAKPNTCEGKGPDCKVPCTWEGPSTTDCNPDGTHRAQPRGYHGRTMKPVINYGPPVTDTDPIHKACKDGCADCIGPDCAYSKTTGPPSLVDPRGWYLLNSYQYYVPKRDGKTCAYIAHLDGMLWYAFNLEIQKDSNPVVGEPAAKRQVYEWCGHDSDVLDNIRGALTYGNHSSPIPAVHPDTGNSH